jgi:hypothetical protein
MWVKYESGRHDYLIEYVNVNSVYVKRYKKYNGEEKYGVFYANIIYYDLEEVINNLLCDLKKSSDFEILKKYLKLIHKNLEESFAIGDCLIDFDTFEEADEEIMRFEKALILGDKLFVTKELLEV